MKIKAKNKKSTTKKPMYPDGGYIGKYDVGGSIAGANEFGIGSSDLSQDWGNSQTSQQSKGKGVSAEQIGGYVSATVSAASPLWTSSKYYTPAENTPVHAVGSGVKGIASAAAPVAAPFIAAGSMLGEGFQTGVNKAQAKKAETSNSDKKSMYQAGSDTMSFFKGMSDPISNYESIDKARKAGALNSKNDPNGWGAAVGLGLTHWLGPGPGFGETMTQRLIQKNTQAHKNDAIAQANSKFPTYNPNMPQNTNQMADGGFGENKSKTSTHLLEKYKVSPHSQLNPNFANAQLDGKPIQLEKNETIFRAANGGDYAFSPNLMDGDKTIAERSIEIDKKYTKPYFDKVAEDTKKLALNELVKKNETLRIAKEQKGLPKAAWGEFGPNIDTSTTNYKQAPQVPQWTQGQESQTMIPQTRGTEWDDNSVSVNPNVYTEYFKNDNNLNPNNYPIQNKYKPDLSVKTNTKIPTKNKGNLTLGDKLQLAGSAVAPLANLANYFRKPEKVKGHFDRTPITPNQQGIDLNPMFLAQNTATKSINEGTNSDAVRRANLANIASQTQQNIGNALLQNKNLNNTLRGQYEDKLAGRTRFNAEISHRKDVEQSQTNAVRQAYLNTAAAQAGQSLVDTGKFKNQGMSNQIQYSTLKEIASNYGLDPEDLATLYKKQGKVVIGFKK